MDKDDENFNNPVGRPLKYLTEEALNAKIQEYFDFCKNHDVDEVAKTDPIYTSGRERFRAMPPTVTGLKLWLDVADHTWMRYADGTYDYPNNNFSQTAERARRYVENDKVTKTLVGRYNANFARFDLINNHDWVDKQEVKQIGDVRPVTVEFIDDGVDPFAD